MGNGRTLSGVTRRTDAEVKHWVDRRVTFDRAVRTKPLAFAADAGRQLCVFNREQTRRRGACGDPVPSSGGIRVGAAGGAPARWADLDGLAHLRRSRIGARLGSAGRTRTLTYEVS
jgi:hypothetical protein